MTHHRNKRSGESTRSSGARKKAEDLDRRIDRLLHPQEYEGKDRPDWITEKDLAESGELFTYEDLVSMKPFRIDDLNSTVAFRVNGSVLRATQRIKEKAGGVYDIMSDLHRDIFMIGLIFLSQRFEDILAAEIIINRAQGRLQAAKEIEEQVRRFAMALAHESLPDQRSDYLSFIEMVHRRPIKIMELYVNAMETHPNLSELRKRMIELERQEEDR